MTAVDLLLSSGFLAFARHAGFLTAVEEVGLSVDGVCGTSSGALVGALWAAGMPAREVLTELGSRRPISWATPHAAVWRGAFRLDAVVSRLREWLPATFEGLKRPFGVGVVASGRHRLLHAGPLPEAVAASCAVPGLFAPVEVAGERLSDGGAVDRLGLEPWRQFRPACRPLVHLVDRSAGAAAPIPLGDAWVVRSPRSGASLWSLGDLQAAFEVSRALALRTLEGVLDAGDPSQAGRVRA